MKIYNNPKLEGFSDNPLSDYLENNPIPPWHLSPICDTFRIGPSHPNKRYVPYGQPYLVEDGEGSSFTDRICKEFFKNIENSKLQAFESSWFLKRSQIDYKELALEPQPQLEVFSATIYIVFIGTFKNEKEQKYKKCSFPLIYEKF